MRQLAKDLAAGDIKPLYLLYGDESYLMLQCRDNIRDAVVPGDDGMNISFIPEGGSAEDIIRVADLLPFFAKRRLVIAQYGDFFKKADEVLAEYIPNIPETTTIIFMERSADSRLKQFKAAAKNGTLLRLDAPDEGSLKRWLMNLARQAGCQLAPRTAEYLMATCGGEMFALKNELDKLCSYAPGREITPEDVELLCSPNIENRIFDMIEAMIKGNSRLALELYHNLLELKESPMRILYNISTQLLRLNRIMKMREKELPGSAIADALGISSYFIGKNIALAEAFFSPRLKEALKEAGELEEAVKTGSISDKLAVELLLVKYSKEG